MVASPTMQNCRGGAASNLSFSETGHIEYYGDILLLVRLLLALELTRK